MGAGVSCIKTLLCLVNLIFFLVGVAVLSVGIWLSVDKTSFTHLINLSQDQNLAQFNDASVIEQGAYVLIAVGALIFIMGFLGCCGSVKESRLMLGLYGGVLLVIFLLYVTVAIMGAVYKERTQHSLQGFLRFTIERWYSDDTQPNTITVSWNLIMVEMSCCGANNYTDFQRASKWTAVKELDQQLPAACCRQLISQDNMYIPADPACLTNPTAGNSYYLVGCYHALKKHLLERVDLIIGCCVALGAIQLCLVVLSFCLCKMISIRKERY